MEASDSLSLSIKWKHFHNMEFMISYHFYKTHKISLLYLNLKLAHILFTIT
jgi:hypothetical protein